MTFSSRPGSEYCPIARNGCTCYCHVTPGIVHIKACCPPSPIDTTTILMNSTTLEDLKSWGVSDIIHKASEAKPETVLRESLICQLGFFLNDNYQHRLEGVTPKQLAISIINQVRESDANGQRHYTHMATCTAPRTEPMGCNTCTCEDVIVKLHDENTKLERQLYWLRQRMRQVKDLANMREEE